MSKDTYEAALIGTFRLQSNFAGTIARILQAAVHAMETRTETIDIYPSGSP